MNNLEAKLNSVIEEICAKDATTVRKILTNLTFDPRSFFLFNGFESGEINEILPSWKKVRKEIRNTFSANHPFFFVGTSNETGYPAFIRSATKSDVFLMEIIEEKIVAYLSHTSEIGRVCYLLNSEEENKLFGGIRELGFSFTQATVLVKYHGIGKALARWLEIKLEENSLSPSNEELVTQEVDTPIENEEVQAADKTEESIAEVAPEESAKSKIIAKCNELTNLVNEADAKSFSDDERILLAKTAKMLLTLI